MTPIYLGLGLLSAAALAFEITLTRLFSVTQWYHFAFLAISVALLGYGASGTILSLVPRWACPPAARRASIGSFFFAVSIVGAYASLNYVPFDSYRIAWEPIQSLYLVLIYLALAVPFFCAGLVTGLLLAAYAQKAAFLYAANLVGSALGGMAPVLLLALLGEGTVLAIAAVGLLAVLVFQLSVPNRQGAVLLHPLNPLLLLFCLLLVFLAWNLPSFLELRISPYKGLSQVLRYPDARVVWQRWNSFSRVDRVTSSAIRSAPGLSLNYPGELPAQDGLFVDGDDLSPVLLDTTGVQTFTDFLPAALAYQLRPKARALVLEPRGGLALWLALSHGAESVVAVESNPLLVEAAGAVYQAPRVKVVTEEGRSYVRRSGERFDLIHLSLSDSYRPVTSGAYSLGERYDLTVEAFQDYLARLQPGGLLVVERWLQLPPSEELRAGATAVEAMRRAGVQEPASHLAVLRDWQLGLLLVKNGPFTADELTVIRQFAQARGLDMVALPGLTEAESNQYNLLSESVYYRAFRELLLDPEQLYADHPYLVRPATDDRPFFFHFFRWSQASAIWQQLGKTWQPWGGSGYFVLLALLIIAMVTSVALIVVPLVTSQSFKTSKELRGPVLLYFGLLGLGFLFVEIPLIQRFILFLGQPVYAFTTVVAALLFFSGLGSLSVSRPPLRWILPMLVIVLLCYPFGLPLLFQALLGTSLLIRLMTTGLSLAPLGFLMGLPFPGGLAWLRERAPGFIPWAWAINGCASVLSSILAAIIALSAGFSWVLAAAALSYAGAWWILRKSRDNV